MSRFWEEKHLSELSPDEWEALCDGCGRCCLVKLEDAETAEIHYTDVACRLLDTDRCRCTRYAERTRLVADCVRLSPENLTALKWMPVTCAYRTVYDGRPLPDWHPLISGDPQSVHAAGISVRGKCESEDTVADDDCRQRVIDWIDC